MNGAPRPRLAVYGASGCGGCEVSLLDLGPHLLDLERSFEVVFFPLLSDHRREAIEGLPDGAVDLCLVGGALRTTHDLEMVRLLRRVSRRLVALGACAQLGSVLGLANLWPVQQLLRTVLGDPLPRGPEPDLGLPVLNPVVEPLAALVRVDAVVPGCPPEAERLWEALELLGAASRGEAELPAPGTVLGASAAALCDECGRHRPRGGVRRFRRLHELEPEPTACLLDQGLVCCGPATRGGCGAACPAAGVGCRGCYGPVDGVEDQGARMMSALAAVVAVGGDAGGEARLRDAVDAACGTLADPIGTLYRHSFATSLMARLGPEPGEPPCAG